MKNYVQKGDNLDFPNASGSKMVAGTPYLATHSIVVPIADIADGSTGAVAVEGCFTLPKVTGRAWTVGAKVFWDVSASKFDVIAGTPATGDIVGCGIAAAAAASGDTTGVVKLTPGNTTVT